MLKCMHPTGVQEFDSSSGTGVVVVENGAVVQGVGVCALPSAAGGLTGVRQQRDKKPSADMGKELLASATEYVRMYLLNSLVDSSGTGAVAIDNKIEQAMDLVKSHLMFAVREEVELLKEQIRELIERNTQLEYENAFLRARASPETLTKLGPNNVLP